MKPHKIRTWCRAIGLLLGACGIALVAMCFFIPESPLEDSIHPARWSVILILLLLASVVFRAAYLIWFRWSPLALRHVINAIFFFVTLAWLFSISFLLPHDWGPIVCLAGVFAWYAIYQTVAYLMIRTVFPPPPEAPPSLPPPLPEPLAQVSNSRNAAK